MSKKVVYLFGAGSTHAELLALDPNLEGNREGLLTSQVSNRVFAHARKDKEFLADVDTVTGPAGPLNIELYISLLENSKIHGWSDKAALLKTLVKNDITGIVGKFRKQGFFLHKGLLELHQAGATKEPEELLGLISLNYDDVLDEAYREIFETAAVNYAFSSKDLKATKKPPLLKLHGSFNWEEEHVVIRKRRRIEIIPIGASKNYVHAPYGHIWSCAMEIITRCDILRIIGCALHSNDLHLVDLLFKAHLERGTKLRIEVIDMPNVADGIKERYGFFRGIVDMEALDITRMKTGPLNPFRDLLRHHCDYMGERRLKRTKFMKHAMEEKI